MHKGCQVPFRGLSGKVGFPSRHCKWTRASSHVEGRVSWFFSSCGRKHGVPLKLRWGSKTKQNKRWGSHNPLVLLQESQATIRDVKGLSEFLSSRCSGIGLHLELRPEPQSSSPVQTWITGFLWSFNMRVRPCLVLRHGTLLSSRGVKVRLPVELT